ncbi:MAG: PD-(D/E)XK nuclease family protein [Rikenellaceae bacterium]|nr:PD-(D/E)XK nuclease family protein [Rikenellaceae bacterium]
MESFLAQLAANLYERYGDGVSELTVVFPSRRARIFFTDALARVVARPVWQPTFRSIDELAEDIAGTAATDRTRLIVELYKVYSRHHDEPFDAFYFWGETLLADFDGVDKYLIDSDMLFKNVADLKEIDAGFDSLTQEQRDVVTRFWRSFGEERDYSDEQRKFKKIWNTLGAIYHEFRAALADAGLAYTGMVYRRAAEMIKAGEVAVNDFPKRFVIAGFNALTESEKVLFEHLAREHKTEFFWDYDHYYLDDQTQEAGLFLRENMRRFPQRVALSYDYKGFSAAKNITVVAAPSDSLQCKYVAEFIADVRCRSGDAQGDAALDKRTAIVLTDENLLVPVLHSMPPEAERINVTMGYPLHLTPAYSFVERLITLRQRQRIRDGVQIFYHEDVRGLLEHPYVGDGVERGAALLKEISDGRQIYVTAAGFPAESIHVAVFEPAQEGWHGLADYLRSVISMIATTHATAFFGIIAESIDKLPNSLVVSEVELSPVPFAEFCRAVLKTESIPYEGEPLEGVQVMGILETRNLDFENVLLLSANDDTFPGNLNSGASFIPYNLRLAYGLPTPQHHEGVYAYYFYRLLQRASNVHLVYSSRADERRGGEPSRYIYQLEYESPHELKRREIAVGVNLAPREPITVEKTPQVMAQLSEFCADGGGAGQRGDADNTGRTLSPTALFYYVQCPLKFYFHSVARLRAEKEATEEVEAPMFGNILHRAMESLYADLLDVDLQAVAGLRGTARVEQAVDSAIASEYFGGEAMGEDAGMAVRAEDYSGELQLVRGVIIDYINSCILPFDAAQCGVKITELERRITLPFTFGTSTGERLTVRFGGVADRIDRIERLGNRGYMLRIVDYKTGTERLIFKDIAALFSPEPADWNAAVLQTMLYAMMLHRSTGIDVQPALYYVREMNRPDYSPLPVEKNAGVQVDSYAAHATEFEAVLAATLAALFDPSRPFIQCADPKPCRMCDYNEICKRE